MRIGFVGAGKVGCSLALYFYSHQCEISGFYSKTAEHAVKIADKTKSRAFTDINRLAEKSDLLFITVPDDDIASVFREISSDNLKDTIVCHCSGSLTAKEAFGEDDNALNIRKISLHPLCAVDSKESHTEFDKVFFFLEGNPEATELMMNFLKGLPLNVRIISSDVKVKYHLAASVVSNQVVALINGGVELLEQCGFTKEDSLEALAPLIKGNIEHVLRNGPVQALTGPVQRGDINTVSRHIRSLDTYSDRLLYTLLSRKLLQIAKIKNPDRDFSKLDKYLSE
jgi:predicted short-subunit dehydrogenase-like oxidoreductase (DUF2520 family)